MDKKTKEENCSRNTLEKRDIEEILMNEYDCISIEEARKRAEKKWTRSAENY
jgi:hypothetical protein